MDPHLRHLETLFLLIYIMAALIYLLVVKQSIDTIIKNIIGVIVKEPWFTGLRSIFSHFLKDFISNILLFK